MTDLEADTPERAFGEESRHDLLGQYFHGVSAISPSEAWKHVYRLLLWIDRTTGLAHCYESDKSQPGRPWYARSLAFHDWLSKQLEVHPAKLAEVLDWLFMRGSERLAKTLVSQQSKRVSIAEQQRAKYAGFPVPGEDPELEAIIMAEIKPWISAPLPGDVMRRLSQRIRIYLSQENKRKNLLGEGFEDVLAFLIQRLANAKNLKVRVRPQLHELPGFRTAPRNEKPRTVDLAVLRANKRNLITVKWSIRADREEQFAVDHEAYARLEEAGKDFNYVLITNEFDAARLVKACERRAQNRNLFTTVVHVNPIGPLTAYRDSERGAATTLKRLVENGRLSSLESWLDRLN